ncbi:YndJ family transporter [Geomicrobium sp. JCM 19055]|uniref:YndJ family transporter n=1 Tax=Geomicrobium sp. JCM 19055 TaxID=1460649 RepID=UPI0005A88110|nr:YndJ family transporter [Geomicrobium sp. JCM 19055]
MKGSIAVGVLLSVIALLYVGIIEAALLLSMFIWVPHLLQLITQDPQIKVDRWLRRTSFVAMYFAIIASVSFFLPQGIVAGLFAAVWLVYVTIIGGLGLLRQLRYGFQRSEEALINLSLMYLPVGGLWLVAGRPVPHSSYRIQT